jgi:hypothetical protein
MNEMNDLYNHPKIKALVSFTKGEGFGRPLLEFTTSQKPVISIIFFRSIRFSCDNDLNIFLPGELIDNVHQSAVVPNMITTQKRNGSLLIMKKQPKHWMKFIKIMRVFLGTLKNNLIFRVQSFQLNKMQEKLDSILDKYVVNTR